MPTKTYYFKGKTKWAKVHKPDEVYNNYQVPLYLTPESWNEFKESGLRLQPKTDEGGQFVTFRRKHEEMNYKKGVEEVIGPPEVFIVIDGTYQPFDGLIGNGSDIVVKVDVYDTKRHGKGHRMKSVAVENLVVYEPDPEKTQVPKMPF